MNDAIWQVTERHAFFTNPTGIYRLDNIQIISDDLSNTTTYSSQDNNGLLAKTDYNGVTTYARDVWGRVSSEDLNLLYTRSYTYAQGTRVAEIASTFPGEGTVQYAYGGDGKRRERNVPATGEYTWYNWGAGWNEMSEEDGLGDLTRSYVPGLGELVGANPATAALRTYTRDHLGSTRGVFDKDGNSLGTFEYTPYGGAYFASGPADVTHRFTGHDWDAATGQYFAPFRYYAPDQGRWTTRDPLGMIDGPNMYAYVGGNPVTYVDPLGALTAGEFIACIVALTGVSIFTLLACYGCILCILSAAGGGTVPIPCAIVCAGCHLLTF